MKRTSILTPTVRSRLVYLLALGRTSFGSEARNTNQNLCFFSSEELTQPEVSRTAFAEFGNRIWGTWRCVQGRPQGAGEKPVKCFTEGVKQQMKKQQNRWGCGSMSLAWPGHGWRVVALGVAVAIALITSLGSGLCQAQPGAEPPEPPIKWHPNHNRANARLAWSQVLPVWPYGVHVTTFSDNPNLCALSWSKFVNDPRGIATYQILCKNLFDGLPPKGMLGDLVQDEYRTFYTVTQERLTDFRQSWQIPVQEISRLQLRIGQGSGSNLAFYAAPTSPQMAGTQEPAGPDERAFLRWFFDLADRDEVAVSEWIQPVVVPSTVPPNQKIFSITDPAEIARIRGR
jgi:hypothetical protein